MGVILGIVAAICFYLVSDSVKLYWNRYHAGESIVPNSTEKQTLLLTLVLFALGVLLLLDVFRVIKIV